MPVLGSTPLFLTHNCCEILFSQLKLVSREAASEVSPALQRRVGFRESRVAKRRLNTADRAFSRRFATVADNAQFPAAEAGLFITRAVPWVEQGFSPAFKRLEEADGFSR